MARMLNNQLGESGLAILGYIKENIGASSTQVSRALYMTTSCCSHPLTPEYVQIAWAGKRLRSLRKKDLVELRTRNPHTYAITARGRQRIKREGK